MWAYRPFKAEILYEKGLNYIAMDEIAAAVDTFNMAWYGWPLFTSSNANLSAAPIVVKGWKNDKRWLDYARAFRKRKYWDEVERFYSGYLLANPKSINERIEYGQFLYNVLGKHESALQVFEVSPELIWQHPNLLLAIGDAYLAWAKKDPSKYENARLNYAKALERTRNNGQAMLSMMRYHLTLKNRKEIKLLLPFFSNEVPDNSSTSELAAEVFSGLAEFHLEENNMKEAFRFIALAESANPEAPEPFFVNAQYWRIQGNEQAELSSLQRTLINIDGIESLKSHHMKMRILSLSGIGTLYSNFASRLIPESSEATEVQHLALESFNKAVSLYDDALSRNLLVVSPEYGRIFQGFGDFLYQTNTHKSEFVLRKDRKSLQLSDNHIKNLWLAEQYYNQAEELFGRKNGLSNLPDKALYRRAYVRYLLGIDGAVIDFHRISRRHPDNYNSRLALATTLLQSGDHEASRIQYQRSIELMDKELRLSGNVLDLKNKGAHQELFIRYVAAWNNLGVSRARSAERGGGISDDYAAALSAFTTASEFLDKVRMDQDALVSRGVTGLRNDDDRRIVERVGSLNLLKEKSTFPHHNRLVLLGKKRQV